MAEDGIEVGALLLNWRKPELTLQCLADLLAQDDVSLHVLVVDNGSGDNGSGDGGSGDGATATLRARVLELAAAQRRHRVDFVALEHNLGFTGGMNRGIAWCAQHRLPFTLVLNNDLRLPPGCLLPLVQVLQNDPRVAAVGPTVLHPDGTVWAEGGSLGFRPNALRLRGHGRAPRARTTGPQVVEFLPAACVLFRTAELTALGGFDERYFMYWEDVDLCDRLRRRGGRIVWLPWVQVVHAAGSSSGGGRSPLRKFLMACNAVRYLRSRGTVRTFAAWLLFDVLLWPLVLLSGPRAAWAKLRGTIAGCRGHRANAADVQRYLGSP